MSYELKIKPKDRASGRFIGRVRKSLIDALIEEKKLSGINQQKLAKALGVNRSAITRMLKGETNLTIRSIGEVAWAMGWEPELVLTRKQRTDTSNHVPHSVEAPISAAFSDNFVRVHAEDIVVLADSPSAWTSRQAENVIVRKPPAGHEISYENS